MNCANHPDLPAAAYCRTCGKPICAQCTRDVRGVIYCEPCLAARLEGTAPGMMPPVAVPIIVNPGPNPALAGVLSAFFPFGVGAVYTGQYAKGLAHLLTFVGLIWGLNSANENLGTLLGLGMAFFYVYQIIDSVRTAKALQLGQPAPDPLGLGRAFGAGEKVDTSRVPIAAIVLIALGLSLLLQTSGILNLNFDRLWPLFLIGLGVWMFARRVGAIGPGLDRNDRRARPGSFVGPAVLVTVGCLSLLENLHGPGWDHTWPVLLLAIGGAKLVDRSQFAGHGGSGADPGVSDESPTMNSPASSPTSEVKHE
jgi:hypothetical protein